MGMKTTSTVFPYQLIPVDDCSAAQYAVMDSRALQCESKKLKRMGVHIFNNSFIIFVRHNMVARNNFKNTINNKKEIN